MLKTILKNIINFYKRFSLKRKNIIVENNVSMLRANFAIYNRICKNSFVNDSTFGVCTYVGWNSILNNVHVGAYTSIGPFVEVIYGRHPIDFVSTHPVFYSTRRQCGISFAGEQLYEDFNYIGESKRSAVIGNDVWIGYGVKIVEGVTIEDGAVVLAGAIVTKDIEAYSVVGGIPAKHIKYRFDLETREMLKSSQWWLREIEWIKQNAYIFLNIDLFKKMLKEKYTKAVSEENVKSNKK